MATRVLVGLGKITGNKPTKKSALLNMIEGHAAPELYDDAKPTLVLSLLRAQRQVAISGQPPVVTYPQPGQ